MTYTAASSDVAVATAAVSGSTLTVTAVAEGSATITVTAMDADSLTAKHTFVVTVGAATPTTPTTPTMPDPTADSFNVEVGKKQDITVNEGEVVYADETNVVAIKNSSTSWSLTAQKKGTHTVQVRRAADAVLVRTITLIAANRAPVRSTLDPPNRATLQEITFAEDTAGETALAAYLREYGKVKLYQLMDSTGPFDLDDYFTEPDGDKLTYKGESGNSIVAVINDVTKSGLVYVDVLKLDTFTFDITFTATDNDTEQKSGPELMVTVSSADVLEQDYEVVQQDIQGNFEFAQVDVGFRSDAINRLVFEEGFLFAQAHDAATAGTTDFSNPTAAATLGSPPTDGQSRYTLSMTGPIKSVLLEGATPGIAVEYESDFTDDGTGGDEDHVIQFEATAPGRATITVTYTIYVPDTAADTDANADPMTASRTLTLNILPVLED